MGTHSSDSLPLTDQFIQKIIDEIMTGKLQVGDPLLSERKYCEEMHVSRAVINGGMRKLEEMGFIKIIPRKGAFVDDFAEDGTVNVINAIVKYNGERFTPEYFEPLLEARLAVEPIIISIAAKNSIPEYCDQAYAILDKISVTTSPKEAAALSQRLISTLACASGNLIFPLICNTFSTVYSTMWEAMYHSGFPFDHKYYQELIDAVRSGDSERATSLDITRIKDARSWIETHYQPGAVFEKEE